MLDNMDDFEVAPPLDLSYHFSEVTKQRQASKIKAFYKYFSIPGIGNLAGGLPHPSYFPFDDLEAKSALPYRFKPTPNQPVDPSSTASKKKHNAYLNDPAVSRVVVPHASTEPNPVNRIDLNTALQYGTAQGYPPLYQFIREFALTRLHPNIPYKNGAEVILTCGSTDGFAKTIECFTNPWTPNSGKPISEREGMLCEEFAYMNAVQTARPRGLNVAPVAIDAEGMLAYGHTKSLYNVLNNWDVDRDGSKRPHIMYTVTMGQNPTSGLLSVKRRKEIYEVCQKFDVLIVEDDPYFYIQFPHAANEFMQKHRDGQLLSVNHFAESNLNHQTSLAVPVRGIATHGSCNAHTTRMKRGKSSGSDFLDSLVPSYLSIDVDGRVIRLDTFSKTIAPGCRLGWLTAQPNIVERILRITETSTQQPSGFVQSIVAELLLGPDDADKAKKASKSTEKEASGWKMDGWIRWLEGLRGNYQRRAELMCQILEEGKVVALSTPPTSAPTASQIKPIRTSRRNRFDPSNPYCTHAAISLPTCSRPTPSSSFTTTTTSSSDEDEDDFELLSKTPIYTFNPPMAGMFIWIRFFFDTHPLASSSHFTLPQLAHAFWIFQTKEPYLLLTAPGSIFAPSEDIRDKKAWQYFRLCFAAIDEEKIRGSSEMFARAAREFWEIKTEEEVQRLLDEDEEGVVDGRVQRLVMEGGWTVSPLMC